MERTHLSLKEKQRREREKLILQVAEAVFIEKGYHETSMEEIAVRVGVAKGTLYLHFPSKEDLAVAICFHSMRMLSQAIDEVIGMRTTARARLEIVLSIMYGGFYGKRAQLFQTFSGSEELCKVFTKKEGEMHACWERLKQYLTALLEEGKANGEFDKEIPTSVMLSAFISLQSPRSYERLVVGEQMSPDELVKHLGRIYFKGIAAS
ncbi:MAG: TetR/AcrR family transcriptional regulator [Chloroflexi bacterium]|nr:MAG: TetR/AcrR family transcriptional regulator [Chloroflexota bacterium]